MVELVDKNVNTVVSYTHDSWGKLLATTGSLAGTHGVLIFRRWSAAMKKNIIRMLILALAITIPMGRLRGYT